MFVAVANNKECHGLWKLMDRAEDPSCHRPMLEMYIFSHSIALLMTLQRSGCATSRDLCV